jgi:hypothetical protein
MSAMGEIRDEAAKVCNRRIFLLTAGSGKGPLPEPTTAVRRRQRDRRRHLDRRLSRLGLPPNKPAEGQLDSGNGNEGGRGLSEVLEIFCKTSVASEPGSLNHSAA